MDNQFRRGVRRPSRPYSRGREPSRPSPNQQQTPKPDDTLIDLYDDVKKPSAGQPDPELEELKKLAQSDALKAYVWLRGKTSVMGNKIKQFHSRITPKHIRLAKVGAVCLVTAVLGARLLPGVIERFSGDSGILGTQTEAGFDTLNPAEEVSAQVYDQENDVAIYKDSIGEVEITVSQQVLPDNLKNNPDELQKLAISLDDKTTINRHETQKGVIYIATTEAQTNIVIFSYNNLLVFIRSNGLLDDQIWIGYVNSLE